MIGISSRGFLGWTMLIMIRGWWHHRRCRVHWSHRWSIRGIFRQWWHYRCRPRRTMSSEWGCLCWCIRHRLTIRRLNISGVWHETACIVSWNESLYKHFSGLDRSTYVRMKLTKKLCWYLEEKHCSMDLFVVLASKNEHHREGKHS